MDLKNNDDEEGDFSNSDGEACVRAGGSHFPYILLNWNQSDDLTTCNAMHDVIFSIIELFPLLVRLLPLKYLLCEKYTANIRWPPRKVTALQVVRTSFFPDLVCLPPWFACIYERSKDLDENPWGIRS